MNELDVGQAVDLSQILNKEDEQKATQLPKPQGYKILCAIPEVEKEFESGILKADTTVKFDELLTTVLFVIKLLFIGLITKFECLIINYETLMI